MICDVHVHVGWYYRYSAGVGERNREPHYYAPQFVSDILKSAGIDEFIFSSISCQRQLSYAAVEKEALDVVEAFGIQEIEQRRVQESKHRLDAHAIHLGDEDVGTVEEKALLVIVCETKAARHELIYQLVVDAFGKGAHPFYWVTGAFFDADPDFKVLDSGIWEGVKIHELETPWVKTRPEDLERVLSILEERNVPVQFHTGEDEGCYPHEILPFVMRHPNLRVDFAHCRPCAETIECLKRCDNLYTDTAFMPTECYSLLISAGLEDRALFGTDLPIQGGFYDGELAKLYDNDLRAAQGAGYSEKVLHCNFKSFLNQKG